jgi:hypothetical protein
MNDRYLIDDAGIDLETAIEFTVKKNEIPVLFSK